MEIFANHNAIKDLYLVYIKNIYNLIRQTVQWKPGNFSKEDI